MGLNGGPAGAGGALDWLHNLIDSVPVAVALRDASGKYLFVNRTWKETFGKPGDPVVGTYVRDRVPPETAEEVLALDRAALQGGPGADTGVYDLEYRGRRYTQTRKVITDAGGQVVGVLIASIDTTERLVQERQLRDQMILTSALIDENPNAMYLKDPKGRYLKVNDAWCRMVGVTREQAIGRDVREIFGDQESERYYATDMALMARGEGSSEVESLRNGPDGRPQWLIIRKAVLRRADGGVVGLVGVNTDITRLKHYEQELETEQHRLALVVRAAKTGIIDWDGVTHANYYSPRLREIRGYAPDADTSGWPEYSQLVHPEDRPGLLERYRAFVKSRDRDAESFGPDEHRLRRADGSYVWVELNGVALRGDGGFVNRAIIAVTDITERRAQERSLKARELELAEQKAILETTLENIDQGITMTDRDLHIKVFNRRFLELLDLPIHLFERGFNIEQAFRYNALRGEYGPGDVDEQVRMRMELARKFEPHAFERKRPNGQVLAIRGQPLPGGEGFVTTYSDVTEQKRAEEQLRQSVALREEVERVSRHDLKTPISSVIAVSRMLRENSRLSPEDAQLLATVERAGYRILNMVNLSLDLFRMEQGIYEFHPQAVDLDEVAAKVATDLQGQAASKNVQVRVARKGAAIAWAEELLCYSMFANLVKNAIEAAPEGTEVTIELASEEDRAVARIHNAGTMPEQVRARFFQKYTTGGKSAGLGLGAYSANLLARAQGGKLTLNTSASEGTTLTMRLPAASASEVKKREDTLLRIAVAHQVPALPALRVLVADDDEFNRLVLQRYLPSPPLKVTLAVNGRAAVDAAAREWPDVVLLDLEMPVMDGYEAARRLRNLERDEHRKKILIVAISSNDEDAIVRRALDAGCDKYLVKPAPRELLLQMLAGATVPLVSGGSPAIEAREADEVVLDADLEAALPGFLASRREALDEMPRVLGAGDRPGFKRLAHRLAGSFALYGFRWAAAESKALERDADGDTGDLILRTAALRKHLDQVKIRVSTKGRIAS